MSKAPMVVTRTVIRRVAVVCVVAIAALALTAGPSMATTVALTTAPTLPTLSGVTLNGQTQTTFTLWTNAMKITSSGTNNGWNLTVSGNAAAGQSAVFKQFCPSGPCGTDPTGYVSGGFTLPADSLTLNTGGASWTGAAPRPTYQCSVSPFCKIDHATAIKVVSASTSVALTTWTASGSSVLTLATPASLRKLPTGEVYHLDVVWTLSSGP
ncbi:MAG TPA: hypothetical protein VFI54_26030 [Solirubrobacteraceae bacterium]|nr:hypothetical protein [Solirubrobacteraceae bacterium]